MLVYKIEIAPGYFGTSFLVAFFFMGHVAYSLVTHKSRHLDAEGRGELFGIKIGGVLLTTMPLKLLYSALIFIM
ncbi:hypothetical protein D3C86_1972770 [compost metagenome]